MTIQFLTFPLLLAVSATSWVKLAAVVLGILFVAALIAIFIPWVLDFRRELHYIRMEIQRNTGEEREYWIKRKKKLWLSILPFFRY